MNNQALKPTLFNDFLSMPSLKNEEEAKKRGVDPQDNAISYMADTEGWKALRGFIENLKKDTDQFVLNAVASGQTRDEVGTYAIVGALLKQALDAILHKVEDAKEAVEGTGTE